MYGISRVGYRWYTVSVRLFYLPNIGMDMTVKVVAVLVLLMVLSTIGGRVRIQQPVAPPGSIAVVVPYFDRPVAQIRALYNHYSSMSCIASVTVIEVDGGNRSGLPGTVLHANDLRQRFIIVPGEHAAVFITDDDMLFSKKMIDHLFTSCVGTTRLVGPFGRRYTKTGYNGKAAWGEVDAVLTKGIMAPRPFYDTVARTIPAIARQLSTPRLNGEDLTFNYAWVRLGGTILSTHYGWRHTMGGPKNIETTDTGGDDGVWRRDSHIDERTALVLRIRQV
jgi:hypothetical protein